MITFDELIKKIENSKPVDFGDILSKSFDLYKKSFSEGIKHSLVLIAFAIPLMLLVYIPLMPMYIDMIENAGNSNYQPDFLDGVSFVMIIVWYLLIIAMSFVIQIVSISVFGRFFKLLKKNDFNSNEDIGGYFTIFKNHFGKLLLLSLATMGISIAAALLCYLPLFYVVIPLHWIFPMFIFNDHLKVSEVIKVAFKFANKNWLIFAGLGIVCSIMASLGAIACYIGLIATMFFTYIATYVTYKETIGFENSDPIEQIGTSNE